MAGNPLVQERASAVYFCRKPSRCVTALSGAEEGRHRFLVGTCALSQRNDLQVVEFNESTSEATCRQVLDHEDEVWLIAPLPSDNRKLLTYSSGKSSPSLRLWRMSPEESPDGSLQLLSTITDDETPLTGVKSVLWDPYHDGNLVAVDSEALHAFQGASGGKLTKLQTLPIGQRCNGASLDPRHPQQISTVDDAHLKTWDLRSSRLAFKKDGVHLFGARDVDYNPNVDYQVVTSGEDGQLRFWDLRNLSKCLKALNNGHHHWVLKARYNSHHDQLVVSCGSDSAVCLWRIGSVASTPLGAEAPTEALRPPDGLIRRYEEHEDSVYSCCWAAGDIAAPWVFASVSFDGKLAVNRVPAEEKSRIWRL